MAHAVDGASSSLSASSWAAARHRPILGTSCIGAIPTIVQHRCTNSVDLYGAIMLVNTCVGQLCLGLRAQLDDRVNHYLHHR